MHDRRRFLAGAAGAAAVAGLGSPARAGASLVSPERLFRWVEEMNELGPRITGGHAHRRYLRLVERQLESYGLPVRRYPVPLDQWEARSWSLKVQDAEGREHRIPVAHYRPHSGETPRRGVTAGLVEVGAGQEADYAGKDVQGRIVVADYPLVRIPFGAVFPLADYIHRPAEVPQLAAEDYTRIWQTPPTSASLDLAKQHGAIAMIDIVDLSPEHAAGQYSPHQQHQVGLPALHLDRVQGRRLRDLMATGPVTATLVLDADKKTTTIDYLTTTLKGDGSRPGAIMLGTHTDGQNAIEENGVPAILALARYFTRLPRSERPGTSSSSSPRTT